MNTHYNGVCGAYLHKSNIDRSEGIKAAMEYLAKKRPGRYTFYDGITVCGYVFTVTTTRDFMVGLYDKKERVWFNENGETH